MKIEDLKGKEILILGLGQEGQDTFSFLRKLFPQKILGLADRLTLSKLTLTIQKKIRSDKKIELHLGKDYLDHLKDYEVIIKSPGISPFLPKLKTIHHKLSSQTKLFFDNCPGTIIGVTGTKGKSTTASLIYRVLKEENLDVYLIGNIGNPALSFLKKANKKAIFVFELSSHQLWDLSKSPHIAVLLNIFPEHSDYYPDFSTYAQAKENITLHQQKDDFFIYNTDEPILKKIALKTKAQKIPFTSSLQKNDLEKIINLREIPLQGVFNLQNVMPAVIIGKIFHLANEKIAQAIRTFKPLEHRLELVGTFKGITFYNDSIATIPEATIEAINTLGDQVKTILLGGFDRQQNFDDLARKILESKIQTVILFPVTGKRIWQRLLDQKDKSNNLPLHFFVKNMKEAIKLAYKHTPKEKICLLSPASPSFGLFKNYQERGNLFKNYIKS